MLALCDRRHALEWGSGKSTAWLAQRFASVVSVEHSESWARETWRDINQQSPPVAVELKLVEPGTWTDHRPASFGFGGLELTAYVTAPPVRPYSMVCVDGRARVACLDHVLANGLVAPGGVLVLDNSERARYAEAIERVDATGWTREDFEDKWRTTLWVRPKEET